MASPGKSPSALTNLVERLNHSKDLAISLVIHLTLIVLFGTAVIMPVIEREPPDFEATQLIHEDANGIAQLPRPQAPEVPNYDYQKQQPLVPLPDLPFAPLEQSPIFHNSPILAPQILVSPVDSPPKTGEQFSKNPSSIRPQPELIPDAIRREIAEFTQWRTPDQASGRGRSEFTFTAFIGQYQGGNWNSTVRVENSRITAGSLPNLLYFIRQSSRDKITTNETNVRAIRLDSDELLTARPPFIFLTGTRDFVLTDKEVENLRKYLLSGGCVWGDSSVPGKRSRFDLAFRREMKRVIPDLNKQFEALPQTHPLFTKGFFPKQNNTPPGLNFYREPVEVMKIYGEIAIIYTANDYGDMWQVGLDSKGAVDFRRNERGQYLATNTNVWNYRDIYLRNLSPESLKSAYEFGTNIVFHLLTRWENRLKTPTSSL